MASKEPIKTRLLPFGMPRPVQTSFIKEKSPHSSNSLLPYRMETKHNHAVLIKSYSERKSNSISALYILYFQCMML